MSVNRQGCFKSSDNIHLLQRDIPLVVHTVSISYVEMHFAQKPLEIASMESPAFLTDKRKTLKIGKYCT